MSFTQWLLACAVCGATACGKLPLYPVLSPSPDAPFAFDAGPADDGPSTAASGWCAEQTTVPTFCEDFDHLNLDADASAGPAVVSAGAFGVVNTDAATSPPASLLLSVDGEGGVPFAFFPANRFANTAPKAVHLQYDLRIERIDGYVMAHQIRFATAGDADYQVQLMLFADRAYATDNKYGSPASFIELSTHPTPHVWSHIDQQIRLEPPVLMAVTIDGALALPPTPLRPEWKTGAPIFQIGISAGTSGASEVVRLDNVRIDLE